MTITTSTEHKKKSLYEQLKSNSEESQRSCFLRPRFYSGQLLTESDLARLDQYIIGKQRLYNRHSHDWGVVCGLVASCDACETTNLKVSAGYAIGPAGEDIVTIEEMLDVCKLLCRDGEPDNPCAHLEPSKDETELYDYWLLSVHYKETPEFIPPEVQPVTEDCPPACPPIACEPNALCEHYEFKLTPYNDDPVGEKDVYGFIPSSLACMGSFNFFSYWKKDASTTRTERLQNWKTELSQADLLHNGTNCQLASELAAVNIPQEGAPDEDFGAAELELFRITFEIWIACICNAMNPPCPTFESGGVPLAVIITRPGECEVLKICNRSGRKMARTLPQLDYWLAPLADTLRTNTEKLCCDHSDFIEIILGLLRTRLRQDFDKSSLTTDVAKISAIAMGYQALQSAGLFKSNEKAFVTEKLKELAEKPSTELASSSTIRSLLSSAINRNEFIKSVFETDTENALQNKINELTNRLDELEKRTSKISPENKQSEKTRKVSKRKAQNKVKKSTKPKD